MSSAPSHPQPVFNRIELVQIIHTYRREHEEKGFTLGPLDLTFHPSELFSLSGQRQRKVHARKTYHRVYILCQAKFA